MASEIILNLGALFSVLVGIVVCYFALINLKYKDKIRIWAAVVLGLTFILYGLPVVVMDVDFIQLSAWSAVLGMFFWSIYTYRLFGERGWTHLVWSVVSTIALWSLFGTKGLVFAALVGIGFVIGFNRTYRRISKELKMPILALNIALILWMLELFAGITDIEVMVQPLMHASLSLTHRALLLYGGYKVARFLGTEKIDDLIAKLALKKCFKV